MKMTKVKRKYKWNVDEIYKTKLEFVEDVEILSVNLRAQTLFKDTLKNYEDFSDFDELTEQGNLISSKIEQFLKILEVDPHHKKAIEYQAIYDKEMEKYDGKFSWVEEELKEIGEKQIFEWLETKPAWIAYKKSYKKFFKNIKYLLPVHDRELLDKISKSSALIYEMYETLKHKDNYINTLDYNNNKYLLNQSEYTKILERSDPFRDQELRALTVRKFHENDFNNKYAYAKIYESIIKEETENLKLVGMKNFEEQFFGEENISVKSFKTLIKFAGANSGAYQKYYQLIKKYWNFEKEFYSSDASLVFFPDKFKKIPLENGITIIREALQPLGAEYQNILNECLADHKIDYFENPFKSSGAFTTFSYEYGSLISMNWNDNFSSLITLGHELGHAVHNQIAKINQPKPLNYFNNIIAEVASTLNEQIIIDYWLKQNNSPEIRANILRERIEFILNNFFYGVQESYFEFKCFEIIDKGENLTLDKLIETNKNTDQEIFGKSPFDKFDDKMKEISWSLSSHIFEQPFYLYKYALSLVMSFKLFQNFQEKKYDTILNFLKEGGSLDPLELFKKYGVDISDSKSYEPLINYLNDLINELEECLLN